jgi:predicted amidohydrolase YtcJ
MRIFVLFLIPVLTSCGQSIAPDNPLFIVSQTMHSFSVNSKAFEQVGIDRDSADPGNGSYYGDALPEHIIGPLRAIKGTRFSTLAILSKSNLSKEQPGRFYRLYNLKLKS